MQGVVRAVCAIIDAYHFGELDISVVEEAQPAGTAHVADEDVQMATDDVTDKDDVITEPAIERNLKSNGGSASENTLPAGGVLGEGDDIIMDEGQEEAAAKLRQAKDIRSALLKRVLPTLNAQLVAKGDVRFLPNPRTLCVPLFGLCRSVSSLLAAQSAAGAK